MAKIFVVGNWKMNPVKLSLAEGLFNSINNGLKKMGKLSKVEVVVCPPFPFLGVGKKKKCNVKVGAQNCFWQGKGAFTGETSPLMLKDVGCEYVILGHSERRKYFSEKCSLINEKIRAALGVGLKPILCIDKISQIKSGLKGLKKKDIKKVIVAYEPIWAIGTGKACGFPKAKSFNLSMKKILGKGNYTLYGGSVNSENALGYITESNFSGLLIGGASLKPREFLKIIGLVDKG